MVALSREYLIDLACIPEITAAEVAERIGVSVRYVEKFYNSNRTELDAARKETLVGDRQLAEVLALWGDQVARGEITSRTGLSGAVIRRLILAAEYDEAPDDVGASMELMALQIAHPDRMYIDDVRAENEYAGGWKRMSAPDAGLRAAA